MAAQDGWLLVIVSAGLSAVRWHYLGAVAHPAITPGGPGSRLLLLLCVSALVGRTVQRRWHVAAEAGESQAHSL